MNPIILTSFGFAFLKKDKAPLPDGRFEDVRITLRNPHVDPRLLQLDGTKPELREVVLATRGSLELVATLVAYIESLPIDAPRRVSIGCVAGRHRSVALIEELARQLEIRGHHVVVEHMHLQRALNNEEIPK